MLRFFFGPPCMREQGPRGWIGGGGGGKNYADVHSISINGLRLI